MPASNPQNVLNEVGIRLVSARGWRGFSMQNQRRPGNFRSSNLTGANRGRTGAAQIIVDLSIRQYQQQFLPHRLSRLALRTIKG